MFGSLDFCFYLCHEYYSNRAMQIVSTREFRANQKKYFELAEHETVFVSRKNARPIVISVADDDDFLSKEELLSIQRTSKTEEQQRLKTSTIYGKVFCRIGWDIKRGFAENP